MSPNLSARREREDTESVTRMSDGDSNFDSDFDDDFDQDMSPECWKTEMNYKRRKR